MAAKRKAISKKVRFEIFKRDGFTCQYCGAQPPAAILEIEHIHPVSLGGGNEDDNLATACWDCNRGKAAVPLSSVSRPLAERAAEVAEREAQLRGFSKVMRDRKKRIEGDAWEVAEVYMDGFRLEGIRRDYFSSIKKFLEKIEVSDCVSAMEDSLEKVYNRERSFRYFCAICWRIIKEQAE